MRDRVPVVLAGACALLGALSILPVFTGDGPLSGVFAVLLGSPWAQLLSSLLGAAAGVALARSPPVLSIGTWTKPRGQALSLQRCDHL